MADDFGERTEPATPRRRQEARDRGQVAKSQDLTAAVVMLAGMVALEFLGPSIWRSLLSLMRGGLESHEPLRAADLARTTGATFTVAAWAVIPLLAVVLIAALAALLAQVGWLFSWHPIQPTLNKISPLQGIKRIFSPQTLVSTVINIGKMLLVLLVAYWTIAAGIRRIVYSSGMDHAPLYVMAAGIILSTGIRLAVTLLVLALIDYIYQRYRHEKDLRMSKEEIREELKRMEGDPLLKRRRRDVQMRLALQRVQRDVPQADVVVTNPTHLAIALKYDPQSMSAPKVVAKGADWMALRIRQIAAAARVPVVEKPALARAMYNVVEVGQPIPERFYKAVAQILAYVYELSGHQLTPRPIPAG